MQPRERICAIALTLFACAAMGGNSLAQEKPDSAPLAQSQQPPAAEPQKPSAPSAKPDAEETENPKRILGIIPNFQTTNDTPDNQRPLTTKEKYTLAWHQMFDISAHLGNAFQSSLQQASNGEPHYGQGWGAYGQRFGASEADQVTSSFFIYGFFPQVFKQDPRYFRKGRGRVMSRIWYAASRTVIARTDSGHPTFNASQVLGQLAQAGISNAYYPKQDRNVTGTFEGWGLNLAYTSMYNVLKEYYPDTLGRVLHRRHKAADETPQVPAAQGPPPPQS